MTPAPFAPPDWVQERIRAGRSATAALGGDFKPLCERARAGEQLGKPELDLIAALLSGELPFAHIEVDARRIPKSGQVEHELNVVNFVLSLMYSGVGKTESVAEAAVEFDIKGDRIIWDYLARRAPGTGSSSMSLGKEVRAAVGFGISAGSQPCRRRHTLLSGQERR